MNLKCFVIFIAISIVSCMKTIQKDPLKYNTKPSNPYVESLPVPSDKSSFPDVVYPTNILDIAAPFYFNNDNNYEVLEPFSEDVKSSYKLLSSITKPVSKDSARNVNSLTEINEVLTPVTDVVTNVSVEENITDDNTKDSKEVFVNSIVLDDIIEAKNKTDSILGNTAQNHDYYKVSLPQEIQNETCSKIPLLAKINVKESFDESKEEEVIKISNHLNSQDNKENVTHLKRVIDTYSRNESSEEINSSSEEHYTELQDIKHSDFIKTLSALLMDLLVSTDNATSEMWNTTLLENYSLERIVLSLDNLTNTECFGSKASVLTDLMMNGTFVDFESMVNFTEKIGNNDEESVKDSKEDYFLDLLVSLDSLCENNNFVTFADNEYLTNSEYSNSENKTII